MVDLIIGILGTAIILGNYISVVPDYLSNANISFFFFKKNQKIFAKKIKFFLIFSV